MAGVEAQKRTDATPIVKLSETAQANMRGSLQPVRRTIFSIEVPSFTRANSGIDAGGAEGLTDRWH